MLTTTTTTSGTTSGATLDWKTVSGSTSADTVCMPYDASPLSAIKIDSKMYTIPSQSDIDQLKKQVALLESVNKNLEQQLNDLRRTLLHYGII